jgi:carboxyl-terminal processing protease
MKKLAQMFRKGHLFFALGVATLALALTVTLRAGDPTPNNNEFFETSKNISIFSEVYEQIWLYYVDEQQPGDLMKTGIDAMLKSLDPYTVYIPESNIEDYRFEVTHQYGGIGALIRKKDDEVIITEPYEGYPAHKAGLIAGDRILEIDGNSVTEKSTSDISKVLKGTTGTSVKLLIQREGAEGTMEKTLTREEVKIPDVPYFGMVDDQTGYIKLTAFTQTASKEVKDAFKKLKDSTNIKRLIFDLRGNGGGLLNESVNIVNLFVPKGEEVVSTKGRVKEMNKVYKAQFNPVDADIPLVVLVDGGSASASEIVSGSIQDLDRGVVVGKRTYGKGLVQQTKNLQYNSKIKLTIAKYYTPSGRCIQKLDYSNRNKEGEVVEVADSLIKAFKTKNGRDVFDGRGVDPDVVVDPGKYSELTVTLVTSDLIFDYASEFQRKNKTVAPPKEFEFSDAQYLDFTNYLKDKEYEYTTKTQKVLDGLKDVAEKEKYLEGAEQAFEELKKKLTPSKDADLVKFKTEIIELLEREIITRYYYQNGRVEVSLKKDPYILAALEVLNDEAKFKGILDGSVKTGDK